jgi:hypothetical protein
MMGVVPEFVGSLLSTAASASTGGLGSVAGGEAMAARSSESTSTADAIADGVAQTASRLLETVQDIPLSTHGVVLGLFIGGLVLAIFGKNSLRFGFALLGLLFGVQLALFMPAAFGFDPSPLIAAGIGGAVGLLVGLMAYKFTVMLTLGLTGAVLAPTAVTIGLYINDPALSEPTPAAAAAQAQRGDAESSGLDRARSLLDERAADAARERVRDEADGRLGEDLSDRLEEGAATLARFVGQLGERMQPYWERMSAQQQIAVVGSSFLGLVLGLAIGTLMPNKSASLITAFAGTAVFLPSGVWLWGAFDLPGVGLLPRSPFTWMGIWLVLSCAFLFVRLGPSGRDGERDDDDRPRRQMKPRRRRPTRDEDEFDDEDE